MVLHIYSLRTPSFPVALFILSVFIARRISSSENSLSRSCSLRVLLLIVISGLSLLSYKLVRSGNVFFYSVYWNSVFSSTVLGLLILGF